MTQKKSKEIDSWKYVTENKKTRIKEMLAQVEQETRGAERKAIFERIVEEENGGLQATTILSGLRTHLWTEQMMSRTKTNKQS